jgi:maleate isomerase
MVSKERQRLGLMIPSSNSVMEPDFYRNLPPSITLHTARMHMEKTTVAGEERMLDEFALPAAENLSTVRPHVVVFGCTSAGALRGHKYDQELCSKVSVITNCPAVSVIESVNEALVATEAKRVLILTPYVNELNQLIKQSVEETGLEVMAIYGLGISENFAIAHISTDKIVKFAKEKIQGLNPDCLFISCTNFPAMEAIPKLKAAFNLPVITSNQAALNKALNLLGRRNTWVR